MKPWKYRLHRLWLAVMSVALFVGTLNLAVALLAGWDPFEHVFRLFNLVACLVIVRSV